MSSPSWHPDPFHRHELRWWDGTRWSDNVMDQGVAAIDPVQVQTPGMTWPTPSISTPNTPPPTMVMPTTPAPAPKKNTGLVIGGVAAVAALGIGAFVVLGGDDDSKQTTTTSTVVVATTALPATTTIAATTTTVVTTTTTPPTTLPAAANADALIAAMPTDADTPADWSRYSEPELAAEPQSGVGWGFCGGDNAAARALASGSVAQVYGPSWDLPDGGWFGVDAYSFPTAADAAAYIEATDLQVNGCMTDPVSDTWAESDIDLFEDGFGDEAVWNVVEANMGYFDDTADADSMLRIIFDQSLSVSYEGTDYSVTFTENSRTEQHGRVVLFFWLYGQWDYQGWGGPPDWEYMPVDTELDAAAAAVRGILLANLTASGAL